MIITVVGNTKITHASGYIKLEVGDGKVQLVKKVEK